MIGRIQQELETALAWLLNPFFFRLRNLIRFRRRKPFRDSPVALTSLPAYAQTQLKSKRLERLESRFQLEIYADQLSHSSRYGTYFFLDILEQAFSLSSNGAIDQDELSVLDVGTKNFDAAPALYQFFRHVNTEVPRKVHVTGIEIDAFRVYRSFYSRFDVAQFYRRLIQVYGREETHRYLAGDFLDHRDQYDIITCFFPFVSKFALLAWGLPRSMLSPGEFVRHIVDRLNPDGLVVIVNQTLEERDRQLELLQQSQACFRSHEITLNFREDKPTAYLHLIQKSVADSDLLP